MRTGRLPEITTHARQASSRSGPGPRGGAAPAARTCRTCRAAARTCPRPAHLRAARPGPSPPRPPARAAPCTQLALSAARCPGAAAARAIAPPPLPGHNGAAAPLMHMHDAARPRPQARAAEPRAGARAGRPRGGARDGGATAAGRAGSDLRPLSLHTFRNAASAEPSRFLPALGGGGPGRRGLVGAAGAARRGGARRGGRGLSGRQWRRGGARGGVQAEKLGPGRKGRGLRLIGTGRRDRREDRR